MRPAGEVPRARLALAGILTLALFVRVLGIGWGLPDAAHPVSSHPDEFRVAEPARRIASTGDWRPGAFNYGSLTLYLPAAAAWLPGRLGWLEDARGFHLLCRCISALAGAGTAALVYAFARAAWDARAGLWSAACMALTPAHALHSHFATPDALSTFFVAGALLGALALAQHGRRRDALLGGAAAGLAAAAKYGAGLALVVVLAAPWFAPGARSDARARLARCALAAAAAGAAFLLACPYALLDFPAFRRDALFELWEHPRAGHGRLFLETGNGWWYHLRANAPYLFGWPGSALALFGVVGLCARRRTPDALLLLWLGLCFALLGASQVRFLRYLLPLVPAVALASGAAAARLPRGAAASLLLCALALCLWQGLAMRRADPRERARAWAGAHLARGARLGVLRDPGLLHPSFAPLRLAAGEQTDFEVVWTGGFKPEALAAAPLDAFALSEFDWREEQRLGNPAVEPFLAGLDERFPACEHFSGIAPAWRAAFGPLPAPHDWLYPFVEVRVHHR